MLNTITTQDLTFFEFLPQVYFVYKTRMKGLEACNGALIITENIVITLDLNIPVVIIPQLYEFTNHRHNVHLNTHCHMDHAGHIFAYEQQAGCQIYSPYPDSEYITSIPAHKKGMGYTDANLEAEWDQLVLNEIGFRPIQNIKAFRPGETLRFNTIEIITLPFPGHNFGHVGFHVKLHNLLAGQNEFLFYSDIGVDMNSSGKGFGPWYGLPHCSLVQTLKDLNYAEILHKTTNIPMISSHGLYYPYYQANIYQWARDLIQKREDRIIMLIKEHHGKMALNEFAPYDVIYHKAKIFGYYRTLVDWWEMWMIQNHLSDLTQRKLLRLDKNIYQLL